MRNTRAIQFRQGCTVFILTLNSIFKTTACLGSGNKKLPAYNTSLQAASSGELCKQFESTTKSKIRPRERLGKDRLEITKHRKRKSPIMHLLSAGILRYHMSRQDAEYLRFRELYILKSFCLLLQSLLGVRGNRGSDY